MSLLGQLKGQPEKLGMTGPVQAGPTDSELEIERRRQECQDAILIAARLARLNDMQEFLLFRRMVQEKADALLVDLRTAELRRVPVVQAQLAVLESVLDLVPEALRSAQQAREILSGMDLEERSDGEGSR